MFNKLGLLILLLAGYFYLVSNDKDKTLYDKTKTLCTKYYNEAKKSDVQIKVNKPTTKEKRFF